MCRQHHGDSGKVMENATQHRTVRSFFNRVLLSCYVVCPFVRSGARAARAVDGKATQIRLVLQAELGVHHVPQELACDTDVFVVAPLGSQVGCNAAIELCAP